MFRFVGFIVVTGFAIYGAAQFFERHFISAKDDES